MKVVKRTGETVDFSVEKIANAIDKACRSVGRKNIDHLGLANSIMKSFPLDQTLFTIKEIQDSVEKHLMKEQLFEVMKSYVLYRAKHDDMRIEMKNSTDDALLKQMMARSLEVFGGDTYRQFIFKRTYARWIVEKKRREMWEETVDRTIEAIRDKIGDKLDNTTYQKMRSSIFKQEVVPSMRLLQFAGKASKRCNVCIYNCSYTAPDCIKDIVDIMYLSMSGTGVGFSVQKSNVEKLPIISKAVEGFLPSTHTVQDSKEGWCDALHMALDNWYAGKDVIFDYSILRPAGARLMTMGGRSSGPQPLKDLMSFTHSIFKKRGKTGTQRLSTLELHDIICKIGEIVIAGGTRRSALISLSDFHDEEMRTCKIGQFWNNNNQRSMANNSVIYHEKPTQSEFIEESLSGIKAGNGERGIVNAGNLSKTLPLRRLKYLGDEVQNMGGNPCMEIILKPREFCNLTEVICRDYDTIETLKAKIEIATIIGTCQASHDDFKYIDPRWAQNQREERLLGVSITGVHDCPVIWEGNNFEMLKQYAVDINKIYAAKLGINQATAVTCVKPSGTTSQMVNSSSGGHRRLYKHYRRNVRISATDPLLKFMIAQGYTAVPETGQVEPNVNTYVLAFPVESPKGSVTVGDVSAMQQLEDWKRLKLEFCEHNPSVTITVKSDEWLDTMLWVWNNWDYITGISFLPYNDHIYPLAPYEEISEEEYKQMKSELKYVDFSKLKYYEKEDSTDVKRELACAGGACEL
jgi:ribonucleoside-diphosphate reductase alpha chain